MENPTVDPGSATPFNVGNPLGWLGSALGALGLNLGSGLGILLPLIVLAVLFSCCCARTNGGCRTCCAAVCCCGAGHKPAPPTDQGTPAKPRCNSAALADA